MAVSATLTLSACNLPGGNPSGNSVSFSGGSPVVQAIGGSATLEITACPSPQGIAQIQQLLSVLSAASVIVAARQEGSARLAIDLCPQGAPGPPGHV